MTFDNVTWLTTVDRKVTIKDLKEKTVTDWKANLVSGSDGIRQVLRETKTIAVLGIKPESHADQPAHYVPAHMAAAGYEIIPVPVYFPDAKEILGQPVFRKVADIGRPIDMVNVFRRPNDIP